MSNTPHNTKTTAEQTLNINMDSNASILCAVSYIVIVMEMRDALSNYDAISIKVINQNNNEYISYNHKGAGYKIRISTYDCDTKILC